ncbi:hypothetical protein JCM8097_005234 [Rhodosporidiobolus ruineniae]
MASLPEPPVTPTLPLSSTASSFLSLSPDPPVTPSSAALYSPEGTPRATRPRSTTSTPPSFPFPEIKLATPLKGQNLDLTPASDIFGDRGFSPSSATTFGSRNPFAVLLAAQSSSSPTSTFSSGTSFGSSAPPPALDAPNVLSSPSSAASSASTPTQGSTEDDLVVYDGAFVNQLDPLPSWAAGGGDGDDSPIFEGFGIVTPGFSIGGGDGDASSAWEDELYASFSDSAPSSPSCARMSPSKTPRSGASSPRKARRTPVTASPRHHPFRAASRASGSPRKSAPGSPARSRPLSRSTSGTGRSPFFTTAASLSPPLSSASLHDGFQLHPTSPVGQQQNPPSYFPFSNLASIPAAIRLTPPRSRKSPPSPGKKTPRSSSGSKSTFSSLEAKLAARAERRRARLARELAEEGRPIAKTAEGFDLEALDRFFGVTPKQAKAMRGGYEDVARREGMLGSSAGRSGEEEERERWRKVEEFTGLLACADEAEEEEVLMRDASEDGDVSSAAETDDDLFHPARSTFSRRRPPPLTLSHSNSNSHSRSASLSTLGSPLPLSAASLASPISALSLASPDPLSKEIRRRQGDAFKGLKQKRSVGDLLKDLFVGGGK